MSIHTFLSNLGITKGRKIIIKSGAKANLTTDTLDFAELGMTHEGELYVGAMDGSNILINANSTAALDDHTSKLASTVTLGHVKVGDNINVTKGVISIINATTSQKGVVQIVDDLTTNDSTKVLSSAQGYALKQAIDSIGTGSSGGTGGITLADIPDSSMTVRGLMTPTQYTKLNGISSGANFTSVDNVLTSTSTTSALSAYQGKVLDDKITAHNSRIYTLENSSSGIVKSNGTVAMSHLTIGMRTSSSTIGTYSFAQGTLITSSGNYSHAQGSNTTASGNSAHAQGSNTTASGYSAHAQGSNTTASGYSAHAQGSNTIASGDHSQAQGSYTIASDFASHAQGRMNKLMSGSGSSFSNSNTALVVGNGTSTSSRSNAFRVMFNGSTYGQSAFNSTGADYAEYFEWQDGNLYNDERVGLVVTLDGDRIREAKSSDTYILGIISANPSVIGDSVQDQYHGMYEKDEFGRNKTVAKDVEVVKVDENGDEFTDIEQVTEFVINPNYNPEEEYIPREQRKEWDAVGLVGKLITRQDGTAQVNGYVKVSDSLDGIVTHSDTRTEMRVMEVLSNDLIRVFIK